MVVLVFVLLGVVGLSLWWLRSHESREGLPSEKGGNIVVTTDRGETQSVRGLAFREDGRPVTISLGAGGASCILSNSPTSGGSKAPSAVITVDGSVLVVVTVENGRLLCDAEVLSKPGSPRIQLRKNVLSERPVGWDWNQNDRAVEVVTEKLVPVFQMYYKTDSQIVVHGVFPLKGHLLVCSESGMVMVPDPSLPLQYPDGPIPINVKRLFQYPSAKHPGQFEKK